MLKWARVKGALGNGGNKSVQFKLLLSVRSGDVLYCIVMRCCEYDKELRGCRRW